MSVVFLEGAPRYLFTPQGYAVVFAMLASYTISRTLVPIINRSLLRAEYLGHGHDNPGFFGRFQRGFNDRFERFRKFYEWVLRGFITHRFIIPVIGSSSSRRRACSPTMWDATSSRPSTRG